MDLVEIVAERTGMSQGRAKIYVEMAKQRALAHTNRTVYITAMDFCVADLACAMLVLRQEKVPVKLRFIY